jgi:hypothetical protein
VRPSRAIPSAVPSAKPRLMRWRNTSADKTAPLRLRAARPSITRAARSRFLDPFRQAASLLRVRQLFPAMALNHQPDAVAADPEQFNRRPSSVLMRATSRDLALLATMSAPCGSGLMHSSLSAILVV